MSVSVIEYYSHLSTRVTWTIESGAKFDPQCRSLADISEEMSHLSTKCGENEKIKAIWGSRHGKAWSNFYAKEKCNGSYAKANIEYPYPDPKLHPDGEQQSIEVEKVLSKALSDAHSLKPNKLFVTPLLRGIQTSLNLWQPLTQGKTDASSFHATVITSLREHKILEHCNRRVPFSETDKLYPSLSWPENSETEEDLEYAKQVAKGRDEDEEELRTRTAEAMTDMLLQSRDDPCIAFTAHSGACRGSWHFFEPDQTKLWGFLDSKDDHAMSEAETRLLIVKVKYTEADAVPSVTAQP